MLQPAGIKDTVGAAGFAAAPAAGAAIATIAAPGAGIYRVELDTWQAGTPDALFTNMELRCGARVITKLASAALVAATNVGRLTVATGEAITVNATAIGTGTYIATIQATQVA